MRDGEAAGRGRLASAVPDSGARRWPPRARPGVADMLLAVSLAYVCAWNQPMITEQPTGALRTALVDSGAYVIILAVCCVAIALRRLAPTAAVVAVGVALAAHVLIFDGLSILAIVACLVAVETCTSRVPRPHAWPLVALGYLGGAAGALRADKVVDPPTPGAELIVLAVSWAFITVAVLTGLLRRRARERIEQALERAEVLAAQQEAERRLAVVAERQRIARDVHDLLGHSLSVIGMQAEGARAVLATNPAAAAEALAVIGRTSRRSVSEVHSLVDMLRADVGESPLARPSPQSDGSAAPVGSSPGLDDVPQLVTGARRAGLPLTLDLRCDAEPPAPVGEAAYRCVQEALTNVMRHAAFAPTKVRVRGEDGGVDIVVENAEPISAGGGNAGVLDDDTRRGAGLQTMRERVVALNGRLWAGERSEGGWRVHVTLPAPPHLTQAQPGQAA